MDDLFVKPLGNIAGKPNGIPYVTHLPSGGWATSLKLYCSAADQLGRNKWGRYQKMSPDGQWKSDQLHSMDGGLQRRQGGVVHDAKVAQELLEHLHRLARTGKFQYKSKTFVNINQYGALSPDMHAMPMREGESISGKTLVVYLMSVCDEAPRRHGDAAIVDMVVTSPSGHRTIKWSTKYVRGHEAEHSNDCTFEHPKRAGLPKGYLHRVVITAPCNLTKIVYHTSEAQRKTPTCLSRFPATTLMAHPLGDMDNLVVVRQPDVPKLALAMQMLQVTRAPNGNLRLTHASKWSKTFTKQSEPPQDLFT